MVWCKKKNRNVRLCRNIVLCIILSSVNQVFSYLLWYTHTHPRMREKNTHTIQRIRLQSIRQRNKNLAFIKILKIHRSSQSNNQRRLMCRKTNQPNNQPNKQTKNYMSVSVSVCVRACALVRVYAEVLCEFLRVYVYIYG